MTNCNSVMESVHASMRFLMSAGTILICKYSSLNMFFDTEQLLGESLELDGLQSAVRGTHVFSIMCIQTVL